MSQPSDLKTEAKPSHVQSELHSDVETKSEKGTTASEDDMFLYIWYPAPPSFPSAYLQNCNFIDSTRAEQYIKRHFTIETIHNGLCSYPDLLKDLIYYSTYINVEHFNSLQCHIKLSIKHRNALLRWSEHIARYVDLDNMNPLLITCVL